MTTGADESTRERALDDGALIMGYQDSFRSSVRVLAEGVLDLLEVPVRLPQVIMVGLPTPGHDGPAVINPGSGPLSTEHLDGVRELADRLYDEHPLRHVVHSNRHVHERRQDGIRRDCVGDAVAKRIAASGVASGLPVVTPAARRDSGDVVVCMLLPETVQDAAPELQPHRWGSLEATVSLLDAALQELRQAITYDLALPDPGPPHVSREAREIVARAADRFFRDALYRAGTYLDLPRDTIDEVAAATYEQGPARGHILIARQGHDAVTAYTSFDDAVSTGAARQVRKLLETTGPQALLVADGMVHGIGRYEPELATDPDDDVLEIVVTGPARWDLRHHGESLMVVRHGAARLPRPLFDQGRLAGSAIRVLGDETDVNALLAVVRAASKFGHGSTLVVTRAAADEARRLGDQAVRVEPKVLTPELFDALARIDGAFLVDEQCVLYAFGVILDGRADDADGDPARGSRYNSAVRYVKTREADGALAVVVSSDGGVDSIPDLPPQVPRQVVEDAVVRLESLAGDPSRRADFADARRALQDLEFYLDEEQAERANDALQRETQQRGLEGVAVVRWGMFDVSPAPENDAFTPP